MEQNIPLYRKIKQLSNKKKFNIVLLTQGKRLNIGELSKQVKIAFNKCSNYCSKLEKEEILEKHKMGKNTLIKSRVIISKNSLIFN